MVPIVRIEAMLLSWESRIIWASDEEMNTPQYRYSGGATSGIKAFDRGIV